MKRILSLGMALMLLAAVCLSSAAVRADDTKTDHGSMKGMNAESKSITVSGEIVDLGCYLGHGAKGAAHKDCADKCIAGGMPMGLLTDKGTLYLLTMSHENADPFNSAKKMAAAQVTITGPVMEKNGMKAIEVNDVKPAMAEKPAGK